MDGITLLGMGSEAGRALRWSGVPVLVPGLEAPVVAFAVVDDAEHDSRQQAGIGAVHALRSLAALWELPYGIPIAQASLPDGARCRLRRLSPSVVHLGDDAERRIRNPVRISGVIAMAGRWRRCATALGAFVTVAPRVAVLRHGVDPSAAVHAEALLWDIGLLLQGSPAEVLLEPGLPAVEHGPYQWSLAERVYAAWLSGATAQPKPPVAA